MFLIVAIIVTWLILLISNLQRKVRNIKDTGR